MIEYPHLDRLLLFCYDFSICAGGVARDQAYLSYFVNVLGFDHPKKMKNLLDPLLGMKAY